MESVLFVAKQTKGWTEISGEGSGAGGWNSAFKCHLQVIQKIHDELMSGHIQRPLNTRQQAFALATPKAACLSGISEN